MDLPFDVVNFPEDVWFGGRHNKNQSKCIERVKNLMPNNSQTVTDHFGGKELKIAA